VFRAPSKTERFVYFLEKEGTQFFFELDYDEKGEGKVLSCTDSLLMKKKDVFQIELMPLTQLFTFRKTYKSARGRPPCSFVPLEIPLQGFSTRKLRGITP